MSNLTKTKSSPVSSTVTSFTLQRTLFSIIVQADQTIPENERFWKFNTNCPLTIRTWGIIFCISSHCKLVVFWVWKQDLMGHWLVLRIRFHVHPIKLPITLIRSVFGKFTPENCVRFYDRFVLWEKPWHFNCVIFFSINLCYIFWLNSFQLIFLSYKYFRTVWSQPNFIFWCDKNCVIL